jgi:NaMN:DMB phosphoribosyltransferase
MKTEAIILAIGIAIAGIIISRAQPTTPVAVNGCIQLTAAPVSTSANNLVQTPFTCDVQGRLRTSTTP